MKSRILFVISCLVSLNVHSQKLEFCAGAGYNILNIPDKYNFDKEELRNDYAYSFALSLDEFYSEETPVKVSLRFTNYSGGYKYANASPGGGSVTEYEFNDYLLGIGLYPLNFNVSKNIELNFGLQLDYVLYSNTKGSISSWSILNPGGTIKSIENHEGRILVGLTGNLAFNINLSEKFYLFPQYNYYMNFRQVRSFRHLVEVGVGKRLFN